MRSTSVHSVVLAAVALLVPTLATAEQGVRKGPWLMEPRPTSITVMVERVVPGPVTVRAWPRDSVTADERTASIATEGNLTTQGNAAPTCSRANSPEGAGVQPIEVRDAAGTTLHEVVLSGLQSGVQYQYEVSGAGIATVGGSFSTPSIDFEPFRFVVFGDTRSNAAIHRTLVDAVRAQAPDFVLHTGDLMADGRREDLWQQFFDIEHDLLRDTPLVPVIGNHEIIRPDSTGIEHFRRYMHVDPDSPDPELDYSFAYGNVRILVANAYDDWTSSSHRSWLEHALAQARREVPDGFVIVAMHWGMCSSGPHGENRAMRAAGIDDLFRQYGVDLMLSGHDHIYERGDDRGLRYIVTGGGGAPLYHQTRTRSYAMVFDAEHHFLRADVEGDHIEFTALRPDGTIIDRCALRHGTGWNCPAPPPAVAAVHTLASLPGAQILERVGRTTGAGGATRATYIALLAGLASGTAFLVRKRRVSPR